jgi:alginate O-acetyltransferase complex protein AlgJ
LRASRSRVELLYPLGALVRHRARIVFPKTETHWTDRGAFVAYRRLVAHLGGSPELREVAPGAVVWSERRAPGDLGSTCDPPELSLHVDGVPRDRRARVTLNNRVINRGQLVECECDTAPDTRCVMFGDSYCAALLPFLAEGCRRLAWANVTRLDRAVVERVRPQLVLGVMAERFLIGVPDDEHDPSLEQWAERKRAQGRVYEPGTGPGTNMPRRAMIDSTC